MIANYHGVPSNLLTGEIVFHPGNVGWPSVALQGLHPCLRLRGALFGRTLSSFPDVLKPASCWRWGVPVLLGWAEEAWGSGHGNLSRAAGVPLLLSFLESSSQGLPSRATAKSPAILIPAEPWPPGPPPSTLLLLLPSGTLGPVYSGEQKWGHPKSWQSGDENRY